MKTEEIKSNYALQSGQVLVVDIKPTKNESIVKLQVASLRESDNVQAKLMKGVLGWEGRVMTAFMSASSNMSIKAGDDLCKVVGSPLKICVRESLTPFGTKDNYSIREGRDGNPDRYKLTDSGEKFYSQTFVGNASDSDVKLPRTKDLLSDEVVVRQASAVEPKVAIN